MNLRAGAFLLALALPTAFAATARADSPVVAHTLVVEVDPGATELNAVRLRAEIGQELDSTAVAPADALAAQARGTIVVSIDRAARTLVVSYRERGAAPITRSIDLPGDSTETERAAVLLAGNLARDEAGELVASLRKSKPSSEGTDDKAPPAPSPVDEETVKLERLGATLGARAQEGHGPSRVVEWAMLGVGLVAEVTGVVLVFALPHSEIGALLIPGGAGLAMSSEIIAPGDFDELARRYRDARGGGSPPEVVREDVEKYWLRAARSEHRSRKGLGLGATLLGGLTNVLAVGAIASQEKSPGPQNASFVAALGVVVVADTAILATGITLLLTEGPIESALHDYEASAGYKVQPSALSDLRARFSLTQGGGVFGVGGRF